MKAEELIGSKVRVKEAFGPEYQGVISSVLKPLENEDSEAVANGSMFRINLPSGGVIETYGHNFTAIEKEPQFPLVGYGSVKYTPDVVDLNGETAEEHGKRVGLLPNN